MDQEKDSPKTFKYSMWDTRTADDQTDMDVIAERAAEETSNLKSNQINYSTDDTK